MKRCAAFLGLLFTAVSAQAGPPPSQTDTGNCQPGLSCNAFIRLTLNGEQIQLIAGFSITSSNPSATINEVTKGSIQKNTASEYRRFARELIEKTQSAISASKCDERVDLIGLAIGEAAMKVTKGCSLTGDKECAQESMVLSCGKVNAAPPATVPWELVLPSNTTTFDKDGSNFDIFGALLRYAELDTLLVEANDITLLLPTDSGMTKTAHYLGAYRGDLRNEEAVFEAYTAMVKYILGYHILRDQQPIKHFNNGVPTSKKTISFVNILSIGDSTFMDESPATPNARIIESDVNVEGSVIVHVLNAAMIPFDNTIEPMSPFQCERKKILTVLNVTSEPSSENVVHPVAGKKYVQIVSVSNSESPSITPSVTPNQSLARVPSNSPTSSPASSPSNTPSRAPLSTNKNEGGKKNIPVTSGKTFVFADGDGQHFVSFHESHGIENLKESMFGAVNGQTNKGLCLFVVADGKVLSNPITVLCRGTQTNGSPLDIPSLAIGARNHFLNSPPEPRHSPAPRTTFPITIDPPTPMFVTVYSNGTMNLIFGLHAANEEHGRIDRTFGNRREGACVFLVFDKTVILKPPTVICKGTQKNGSPLDLKTMALAAQRYYLGANFVILGSNGLKSFMLGVDSMKVTLDQMRNAFKNSPNKGACIFEMGSNEEALLKPILVECAGNYDDGSPLNTEILGQEAFFFYRNEVRPPPQ